MNNLIKFGENVEDYNIPVLNEREIRASAGILFLATFFSLIISVQDENFEAIVIKAGELEAKGGGRIGEIAKNSTS